MRETECTSNISLKKTNRKAQPMVSVIMPVYNAEQFLTRSVLSIMNQTYGNVELICVDDGSIDSSLRILNKIKGDYPLNRMKIISQKNFGPAAARNKGLDEAEGDYIAFLDSDDYVEPNAYEKLINTALKSDADIVVFGGSTFPDSFPENQWIMRKLTPSNKVYNTVDAGKKALLMEESSKPFLWQHFIKREIIESNPRLRMKEDFKLGEDQIFIFSYFPRARKVVYIANKLYHYRVRESGSIMNNYNKMPVTKFKCHLGIVKNVLTYWKENNISDVNGEMLSYFLCFLYNDFQNFSEYMKIKFAKEIVDIFESCEYDLVMCNEYAYEIALEFKKISQEEIPDIMESLKAMENGVKILENEIASILSSKAYKIGKLLTPKKKRVDEKWLTSSENKSIF